MVNVCSADLYILQWIRLPFLLKHISNSDLADVQKYKSFLPKYPIPRPTSPKFSESCLTTKFFSGDIYLFLIIIAPPQAVKGLHRGSVEFTVRSACPGSAFHWWWWVIVGALPNLPTSGSSGKVGSVGAPYLGHVGRVKWANACNALKHTKCSGKVRFYHSCYYFIYMMIINHLY